LFDGGRETVLLVARRDELRPGLDLVIGIAHGNPDAPNIATSLWPSPMVAMACWGIDSSRERARTI